MIILIYTLLCKLYTYCVNFYTYCANSGCFVAYLPLFQFTRFCVKIWPKKLRSGKSFDKYHVWQCPKHKEIVQVWPSIIGDEAAREMRFKMSWRCGKIIWRALHQTDQESINNNSNRCSFLIFFWCLYFNLHLSDTNIDWYFVIFCVCTAQK